MASHTMTATYALQLTNRVLRDDDTIAEPLLELLVGVTNPRGDPVVDSLRTEVLKNLYTRTDHFRSNFRSYLAKHENQQVTQTSAATS
jgi:hypothetical protein